MLPTKLNEFDNHALDHINVDHIRTQITFARRSHFTLPPPFLLRGGSWDAMRHFLSSVACGTSI